MTRSGLDLDKYRRIHYLPNPTSLDQASEFIANTLLLSHGIRRDTVSIVKLKCCLLIAPGDTLRQLRPDYETRIGWIRAVLRGRHRGLGAILYSENAIIEDIKSRNIPLLIARYHSDKTWIDIGLWRYMAAMRKTLVITYVDNKNNFTRKADLAAPYSPGVTGAIVNILIDNLLYNK